MLEVKLTSMKEEVQAVEAEKLNNLIFHHFPSTHILEQFGPRVSYKISAFEVTSLAQTFEILEQGMLHQPPMIVVASLMFMCST